MKKKKDKDKAKIEKRIVELSREINQHQQQIQILSRMVVSKTGAIIELKKLIEDKAKGYDEIRKSNKSKDKKAKRRKNTSKKN